MDLTVSPDLDAYYCYAVVLLLGFIAAWGQISKRLDKLPGKWIMVHTWLLFFAYMFLPVALFWFLDRSNAIHDTSLFAAILIGFGYRQILSGELSSIRPPGDFSKFWQPFTAWADHVADRIRNRVFRNEKLYDERLLNVVRTDDAKLKSLHELAFTHTRDVPALSKQLKHVEDQRAVLGETGVLMRIAETLYDDLKISEPETWPFLLHQRNITSNLNHYWYGREWRSKTAAICVAVLLVGGAALTIYKLWTPQNRGRYYLWRIEKANNTDQDRYRAGRQLMNCLRETRDPYPELIGLLRFEGVPVKVAENILTLVVESREIAFSHQLELPVLLADSLRTNNPDIRTRVHAVLLYLADERKIDVGTLRDWKPSAQDSSTNIDDVIKRWKQVKWTS